MNLERRIVAGLIVSDDYLRRVAPFWSDEILEGPQMRRIARWCLAHFERYRRAPDRDIDQIYMTALREDSVPKAEAELIEMTLEAVSADYGRGEKFNSAYLYDQTVAYCRERELARHNELVADLVERGRLAEAEALASSFRPRSWVTSRGLDVGTEPGYERIRVAFAEAAAPIIKYPGALGELLNRHLIRGGFVAFMGPEKRGKTHWVTDVCTRALRQKCNVAVFQAGDMTEAQYLRRLSVHLARRSDDPQYSYSGTHWRPVGDCVLNQCDRCHRADRNCEFGILDTSQYDDFLSNPNSFQRLEFLADLARRNPDYRPCASLACSERRPCVWIEEVPAREPLTGDAAERVTRTFFERYRRRFRLVTYPSGTLSCDEIRSCLDEWQRQDEFVPDVIATDYADIMAGREREYRHRQNEIWMGHRSISEERHALVVTATQTDADSYKAELLKLGHFSDDKRKFGHVTAMFGLNQDPSGREKDLGVMRINTIVAREGSFNSSDAVCVLQDLAAGRPFVGSFHPKGSFSRVAPVPNHPSD